MLFQFIVEDSVEERMLELQEKKRKLMHGAFGQKQTAEEKRQTRINEIKTLMNLWIDNGFQTKEVKQSYYNWVAVDLLFQRAV